ncbi:MAG: exopolysaccharide biosynthesis polyprenyl glycosylphosphotransferase [Candidatus Nanopelagicales bacterium]
MSVVNGHLAVAAGRSRAAVPRAFATPSAFRHTVIVADWLVVVLASIASPVLAGQEVRPFAVPYPALASAAVALVWLAMIGIAGAQNRARVDRATGLGRLVLATVYTLGAVAIVTYASGIAPYRVEVLSALTVGLTGLLVARSSLLLALRHYRAAGQARIKVLVVSTDAAGSGEHSDVALDARHSLAGRFAVDPRHISAAIDRIAARAAAENVDEVLVQESRAFGQQQLRELAWALEPQKISLGVSTGISTFAKSRLSVVAVGNEVVVAVDNSHQARMPQLVKRVFDAVCASVLLVIAVPIILIAAVAIRLETPGAAFFVQPRVGKDGKLFPFIKLRSMHQGAHLDRAAVLGPTDDGILERYLEDDRITKTGKFIRRWSIDELPQLLNVLMGHMSLVGPRPVLEEELDDMPEHGDRVQLVKPGLTGLWQISGRKEIVWDDRIDIDLDYVDQWSLGMDAKIIAHTAGAITKGSGAY